MAKGHVFIDENRCKGCTLCTTVCPQSLLHMAERLNTRGYHPAEYIDPDGKCTGCALCAVICPDVCMIVYKHSPALAKTGPAVV
jgi:2-oxoglutarate ferredoxin oxidoreductase subunit delta